ncbi:hypothetical protein KUTeg_004308 [Tegillarca granosa]|uniref:PDZ domain-containing protein n=1 Tax=Tegillarca granosa TaxID=220873 RepID=A0ABQ9FRB7_TEGGR|nr:hypothetical protein KUTeg_004308 [Tegillarca granosa]
MLGEENGINVEVFQNNVNQPQLMLRQNEMMEDSMSVSTMASNMESSRDKFRFAFSREKEDELIIDIGAVVRQNYVDLPLTPAYIYCMCIEYACRTYEAHQLKKLLLRILATVRENVSMILYLRGGNFKLDRANKKAIDDPRNLFSDLATGLEEIVVYCFQQTIYTVTKALYSYLPEILDSNPFSEVEPDRKSGMGKLIGVLNYVAKLTSSQFLHIDVGKQIFMYLFFFCSTSVFNRLLLKDSGHNYYNWPSGYDWMSMRRHFHPLNEAQLFRLLSQYDLAGKSFPKIWRPLPEDKFLARQEENIMLEMSQHPPFLIPQDVSIIDLVNPPDNPGFWAFFKQLHAQFGVHEDESDSGISPNTTPRFTGNFPKVELQKSFFRQGCNQSKSTKKTIATKSKHSPTGARTSRRVQFASANEAERRQNSPRDYNENENLQETIPEYDCDTGSDVTDMSHDKRNNNVTNKNSHSAISNCQSADYRLDLLINNPGTLLPNEAKMETHVVNNTQTSPPPLPPRGSKTYCNGSDTENSTTSSIPPTKTRAVVKHVDSEYKEDLKLNINKSDILDANGITNDLLYELNNENMEGKKRKSLNNDLSSISSDSTPIIFNNLNSPPTSPSEKNSNLPVYTVTIAKGDKGLGLGLIDGLYTPLRLAGIYIRKILPESPAADGGQLHVGDRILSVNNKSIIGADYQSAMKLIRVAGENLTLIVAKGNHSVATKISSTSC